MLVLKLHVKKKIKILDSCFTLKQESEVIAVPQALFYLFFSLSNCSFPFPSFCCFKKLTVCALLSYSLCCENPIKICKAIIIALVKSHWSCVCYSCFWFAHSVYMMLCFPDSQNVEFICNVLVVADQLLISRLKEICEVAIAEKREFFHL